VAPGAGLEEGEGVGAAEGAAEAAGFEKEPGLEAEGVGAAEGAFWEEPGEAEGAATPNLEAAPFWKLDMVWAKRASISASVSAAAPPAGLAGGLAAGLEWAAEGAAAGGAAEGAAAAGGASPLGGLPVSIADRTAEGPNAREALLLYFFPCPPSVGGAFLREM